MFSPTRLTIARHRRGWTKTQLAQAAGLTSRTISGYESGEMDPSEDALATLARVLRFPAPFFRSGELDEPPQDHVSFRALSTMTAAQRKSALAAGALAIEFSQWLDERFELPPVDLLEMRGAEPEVAADALRRQWGIGEKPIGNLVHLLERSGVRVFSLAEQCREVDAFSLWRHDRPFVFLNTQKTPEHSRFDAAHELGHLLLHRHGHGTCELSADGATDSDAPGGRAIENEANAFAAALLMPRRTLLSMTPRIPSFGKLLEIKKVWRVSLAALVHRLHRLGVLNDWQYRQLCIEISRRGFREQEPDGLTERESSKMLDRVFSELRDAGMMRRDVAQSLHLPLAELEGLVFGLTLAAVEGNGTQSTSPRGQLRLVK